MNNQKNNPIKNDGSLGEPISNGTGKSEAALREEKVLEFWRENKIFEKSLEQREGKKEFIFYEGPPGANGRPHIGHLPSRAFKDAIPRYKTMQGYHVRRKSGWDTHGLPVELQVEKKLGLNSKKGIEEYGIENFNQQCKESVWEYLDVWNLFTERMGYWLDQKNPYVTYHNEFIESVWNVVKKINEQKLLYRDYKVVPWCPRCGTALSSHELAQGYEDVKDLSVYVKFKVKNQENTYMLAWTTTPWTLPGNVALAVGKDISYVKVDLNGEKYIYAKDLHHKIWKDNNQNVLPLHGELKIFKGSELIGLEYEPLFYFFPQNPEYVNLDKSGAYKVYPADFVNTEDGTGIVHTAVMYGQDDFDLGTKFKLPKFHLVNPEGKFIKGTGFLEDRFVKEVDVNGKPTLAVDIIEDLKKRNLFFKQENYKHSYPHCWRCHTALIYYARDSWYIKMSDPKIKEQMISENKQINWEPAYTRDGRFGEWLREIKDWAISRERYWGTPLPVWHCMTCKKIEVIGGAGELRQRTKKSGNKYFVVRHGESESNVKSNMHGIVSSRAENLDPLTKDGIEQVKKLAEEFKNKKLNFDFVFVSPFMRTRETLEILKNKLAFRDEQIIFDKRLGELDAGDFEGKPWDEYRNMFKNERERFLNPIHGGESVQDVKNRVGNVMYELEEKYKDKNILIISHGSPIWMLFSILCGYDVDESITMTGGVFRHAEQIEREIPGNFPLFLNAECRVIEFIKLPHNKNYELDLHRPYIDQVKLVCDCSGDLIRTKEVMDVWFDSGCMPFAQDHYPFENKKWVDGPGYPADYICEGLDQTRGWFYTLHAVGILMGRGKAYKNVICLGLVNDAKGQKMSKSVGNVVDPFEAMDQYGVDTLRMWMFFVNQPGESKNFDPKTVLLLQQQVFGLLYNILSFYELYRDKNFETNDTPKSKNVLDIWILARLNELIKLSTENLDNYKLLEPVRAVRDFIGDLSTWYLRRSRERIKDGDSEAKYTLYFVLKNLTKLIAPFAPFAAEDIWQKLKTDDDAESVHLESWPEVEVLSSRDEVLENMKKVRNVVSLGLEARQKAKIPVRQPLSELKVKNLDLSSEYLELIKDEINVKNIEEDKNIESEIELDTTITPALKAEGEYREFMRELQDERKKLGLNPGDKMALSIEKIYKKYKIMPNLQMHMLRVAAVATLVCDNIDSSVNKEDVVTACLLHDMGNIVKFDFKYFLEVFEPEGVEYWGKIKEEYIEKYRGNDHEATTRIVKELGLSEKIFSIIDKVDFPNLCKNSLDNDMATKIIHYSDMRVGPYGVLSYEDRMEEANKRYKDSNFSAVAMGERELLIQCGRDIEKQIFAKCKIKPEDINDEAVSSIIEELKNFVLE